MKIIFFGTPEFVISVPGALLEAGYELSVVVTTPDKPVGRKQIVTPSPLKTWALEHQIPVIDTEENTKLLEQIQNIKPDLGILAAYGKILSQKLIDLFPKGILVIHPSLLPKYRGASPVQTAILNNDPETGSTIFKMDEKMDHGPIVHQFTEAINPEDTSELLLNRLFQKSAEALVKILPDWLEDKINPLEQDESKATYTKTFTRQDGYLDLKNPPVPEVIEKMIRAFYPWPGVWTLIQMTDDRKQKTEKRLKILKAHLGNGELVIDQVQLEGKNPISWEQFQKSYPEVKF